MALGGRVIATAGFQPVTRRVPTIYSRGVSYATNRENHCSHIAIQARYSCAW